MHPRTLGTTVLAGVLLALAACQPDTPDTSTRILPESAAPGSSVVVQPPGLREDTRVEAVRVRVGEQPALVLDVAPEAGISFLVPAHPPGDAEVTVEVDGKAVGAARLDVLAPPARQLVLTMRGDRIELVANRGAAGQGRPSREYPEGPALAYDLVTTRGVLVATGTLSHPLRGRREVFEDDGTMHGVPEPESATFTLRIPALPQGGTIRFFESEAGADLATAAGRAARRQIAEIPIGGMP